MAADSGAAGWPSRSSVLPLWDVRSGVSRAGSGRVSWLILILVRHLAFGILIGQFFKQTLSQISFSPFRLSDSLLHCFLRGFFFSSLSLGLLSFPGCFFPCPSRILLSFPLLILLSLRLDALFPQPFFSLLGLSFSGLLLRSQYSCMILLSLCLLRPRTFKLYRGAGSLLESLPLLSLFRLNGFCSPRVRKIAEPSLSLFFLRYSFALFPIQFFDSSFE